MQYKVESDLQRRLRMQVDFKGQFKLNNEEISFIVKSNRGIEFISDFAKYHKTGFIENGKGQRIFYQYWFITSKSETVIFVPGSFENSCTHPKLIYNYLKQNYNVLTFDQESSGDSDGIRGQIDNLDYYIQNFELVIDKYIKETKKNNMILTGFSFGAFLILYYLVFKKYKKINLSKLILFAPYLKVNERIKTIHNEILLILFHSFFSKEKIIRVDKQLAFLDGTLDQYINLNKYLTDNIKFLTFRKEDTRIHTLNSIRWISEVMFNQNKLLSYITFSRNVQNYLKNQLKLHIFYCENEMIVDNMIIKKISRKLGISDKLYFLEGFYHDFLDYENELSTDFYKKLNSILES